MCLCRFQLLLVSFDITYCQTSNISRTLVGHKIVDHSDVVGASRCSNYIFILDLRPSFNGLGKANSKARQETFKFGGLVRIILEVYGIYCSISETWEVLLKHLQVIRSLAHSVWIR